LILKPLPIENSGNLVQLFNHWEHRDNSPRSNSSWNQYVDLKGRTELFEGCAIRNPIDRILSYNSVTKMVKGQAVTADFFELMRTKPFMGRFFTLEEINPGPARVLVLTQSSWENDFDADPKILGKEVLIDYANSYTIIGVAPRNLEVFDNQAKFFIPLFGSSKGYTESRYQYNSFDLWLRLAPGVTREAAIERVREIEQHWYDEIAIAKARQSYRNYDEFDFDLPHPMEQFLFLLEAGSILILLAGTFNVMNLVLSRISQKASELAVRNALGAGKMTLHRLMLVESALLICGGLFLGLILSFFGVDIINSYLTILSPGTIPIEIDLKILLIIIGVAIGLTLLLGILPIELLFRTGSIDQIDSSQQSASTGRTTRMLNNSMVVGQVAIAVSLLIGSILLIRSFQSVMAVDPGFEADSIVRARLDYSVIGPLSKNRADAGALKQRIYSAMKEIPGVESIGLSMYRMLSTDPRGGQPFHIKGESPEKPIFKLSYIVSHDYLTTLGVPIIDGRNFNENDNGQAVIVDELFVERFLKGRNPIGIELAGQMPPPGGKWDRIVGVSARANVRGLEDDNGIPIIYHHGALRRPWWEYTIIARSQRPAATILKEMNMKLREVDPRLNFTYSGTLADAIDEMLVNRKGITQLLTFFAALALFLSAFGVYAVLAYDVSQRNREIGIRRAIGASQTSVSKMIVSQGLWKTLLGLGLGFLFTLYGTRFLESQLFGITALDYQSYAIVFILFLLVALLASYLPASKAAKVDPIESLKSE
ncbi:MAG: ABC transporter permease, partial [Opitutales bacterium]|nr:ABC transporter permease [Opitutales bacterium]